MVDEWTPIRFGTSCKLWSAATNLEFNPEGLRPRSDSMNLPEAKRLVSIAVPAEQPVRLMMASISEIWGKPDSVLSVLQRVYRRLP